MTRAREMRVDTRCLPEANILAIIDIRGDAETELLEHTVIIILLVIMIILVAIMIILMAIMDFLDLTTVVRVKVTWKKLLQCSRSCSS